MARTKSYIYELPLNTNSGIEKALRTTLKAGAYLRNQLIKIYRKEAIRLKKSDEWKAICKLPQKTQNEKDIRNLIFSDTLEKYGFSPSHFERMAEAIRDSTWTGIHGHIQSHDTQAIAKQICKSYQNYLFFGKGGLPRFKKWRNVVSFEGKTNDAILIFRGDCLTWKKQKIPVIFRNNLYEKIALESRVKYCRVVQRKIKKTTRYFVQLILEGIPPQRIQSQKHFP